MELKDIVRGKAPVEMLYHWEKTAPNKVYLRQPIENQWHQYTWGEVADQARRLVTALRKLGLKKGDKVAIMSKNCAEWIITDLALQLGGYVSVPLYFDQTPDTFTYILEHSESKALFIGKLDAPVWRRLRDAVPENLIKIGFSFHGNDADFRREGEVDYFLRELISHNQPFRENPVPADEDVWTIVYTSGTTGYPKGAVHCYRAPRHVSVRALEVFGLGKDDRLFSFLPLAHVAERLLVATTSQYGGMEINFAQSLETFQRDLGSVQPTIFFSVPRLWKKFQGGILEKLPQHKMDRLLRIPLLNILIRRKLRKALGLSRARLVISGAAPIAPSLLSWYKSLNIEILEGYGMTENFAYGFIGRPGHNKIGTVGKAMPDCGFKMSPEGEVLFKSPTLMQGYYKDEEKSREALTADGYYRSGDLAELDAEGFLKITGRVKEIFKTEKGEYVAPAPVESKLATMKDLEQICLGGSGLPQPVVVVTLVEQVRNVPREEMRKKIEAHIRETNPKLLNHEKVAGVIVSTEDWLPSGDLVTPTLKVKRNKVEERFGPLMAQLVNGKQLVMWEDEFKAAQPAKAKAGEAVA
ncbi:MAG: AMP-binding protein [Hahellaceae bacterium]|nr:AMP-binding protein [Hahellaceae bacterium]